MFFIFFLYTIGIHEWGGFVRVNFFKGYNFVFYLLIFTLLLFINSIIMFQDFQNLFISIVLFVVMFIISVTSAFVAQVIKNKIFDLGSEGKKLFLLILLIFFIFIFYLSTSNLFFMNEFFLKFESNFVNILIENIFTIMIIGYSLYLLSTNQESKAFINTIGISVAYAAIVPILITIIFVVLSIISVLALI